MNQFYHTLVLQQQDGTFKETEETGSFSVNAVNRTAEYEKGKSVVILNDWHEHTFEQPQYTNTGKIKSVQRQKQFVCSEIFLTEADSARYRTLTELK